MPLVRVEMGGKMGDKVKTKARVRVSLEICLPDAWESDCRLGQVYSQSKDSARNIVHQRIVGSMKDVRIIGEPKVEVILVEE